jgi:nicotinamide-nucleotide amidase
MHLEIINTGSELLLGTTLNTHGAWMGTELMQTGLRVQRQTTVPDGPTILEVLQKAMTRSDVVIVTGGIGPTSDDITREAAAEVLDVELVNDPASLRAIQDFFNRRNRPMAEENKKQALIPKGATALPNPNGTAPGIYAPPELNTHLSCALFLLPGPPREMQPMFRNEVVPRLSTLHKKTSTISSTPNSPKTSEMLTLRFTGIGESDFHAKLDPALSLIQNLEIGYCARPGEVDLRLIGPSESLQEAQKLTLSIFPQKCFSTTGKSLEEVVVAQLTQQQRHLALAESCTGGRIANRITDVSGASSVFTHGYVTYSNEAKQMMLGVQRELLDTYGAVSQEVAAAMAYGARTRSGADIAASVTGIAGPTGGTKEKPVGTVWIGISTPEKTEAIKAFYPQGRKTFKQLVSQKTLDLIRLCACHPSN